MAGSTLLEIVKEAKKWPLKKFKCAIQITQKFSRMKSKFFRHSITKIVRSLLITKKNKIVSDLVVSYRGSAIGSSREGPVFQIIMEYVDG